MDTLTPWEMGRIRDTRTRNAYADWLQTLHWDYILTVTFRKPRVDGIRANSLVWEALHNLNCSRAFLATERYKYAKDIHIHGLLAEQPGWLPGISLPWVIWERMHKLFGRSTCSLINSPGDVATYCSKYVTKAVSDYGFYGNRVFWEKLDKCE